MVVIWDSFSVLVTSILYYLLEVIQFLKRASAENVKMKL